MSKKQLTPTVIKMLRVSNCSSEAEIIVTDLIKSVQALLKAHEQLMPGIGHIACSDYAVVNEAPILARAALAAAGVKA